MHYNFPSFGRKNPIDAADWNQRHHVARMWCAMKNNKRATLQRERQATLEHQLVPTLMPMQLQPMIDDAAILLDGG